MKIAIYNGQLYVGGIERVLITYLQELSKERNLDITLIIKQNLPEKNFFKKDIPENIKVEFIRSAEYCKKVHNVSQDKRNLYKRLKKQWYLFYNRIFMQKWVNKYFKENDFDFIIDFDGSLAGYLKNIKLPVGGWIHYTIGNLTKKKYEGKWIKYNKYSKIVAICDDMMKEFQEVYPEFKDKGLRIYNPINYKEIELKMEDNNEVTEDELLLMKQDYLIAVGRLAAGKNFVEMIEIYKMLKEKGRTEKLYILGNGDDKENIEKKIKELNLQNDIFLVGAKKNPYIWMKNAKLFLHTSKGEGLGMVLIESMICGTIVVAYDCPTGPREILDNGLAGGLLKIGDKKGFVEKVIDILEDNEKQKKIKNHMKMRINEFKYNEIKKSLFKLFRELKEIKNNNCGDNMR